MNQLYITLYMDLTSQAPRGPGWYVSIQSNEGIILPATQLLDQGALGPANALQDALNKAGSPEVNLGQIALEGTQQITEALRVQLQHAQEQAAKLPILKQRVQQLQPQQSLPDGTYGEAFK